MVFFEHHSWITTIIICIVVHLASKILHVYLKRGNRKVLRVVLVDPGASGLVVLFTNNYIRIVPRLVASDAYIAKPASLSAIRPKDIVRLISYCNPRNNFH